MTGPTVVLVVRVYPAGTRGTVLLEVEQQGPVFLTPAEAVRTLRAAAASIDKPEEGAPAPPHRYWPGSTNWCLYVFGNRVCGLPWDDPIHGLDGWGLEQQQGRQA